RQMRVSTRVWHVGLAETSQTLHLHDPPPLRFHTNVTRSALSPLRSFSLLAAVCALICALARTSSAADRPTLAGVWNAGPLTERWNIGQWGKPCGPQPTSHEQPGGQVTVREEAGELLLSGLGTTFRTNECWEPLPRVTRATHSAADHAWR